LQLVVPHAVGVCIKVKSLVFASLVLKVLMGPNGNMGKSIGLAPIECDRPGCTGCIKAQTLAYINVKKGGRAKCLECAKLKPPQTRYFKLPPGAERLFDFGGKSSPNGNSKGFDQTAKLKQQDAKIAELERKLAQSIKSKESVAEPLKEGGANEDGQAQGFNKEDAQRIKVLNKQLFNLENLDDEQKETFYPKAGEYDARIQAVKAERQQIWAKNRARLPIKTQYARQSDFVKKLEDDLKGVKEEQQEVALKFQQLQEKVDEKIAILAEKKAELADLAVRAAQEDALKPEVPVKQTKSDLAPDQVELFDVLRSIVSKSNVLELIKKEGATDTQLNAMESMWSSVSHVVHASKAPPLPSPQQGATSSVPALTTSLPANGGVAAEAVDVPVGGDGDMDVDVIEPLWQKHLVDNPEINGLEAKDLERRKSTFIELQRASKRSKTSG